MAIYLIRIGEGSKYINEARQGGFVAIGWNGVGDLLKIKSVEQIKKALTSDSYKYTSTQISINARIWWSRRYAISSSANNY